MFRAGVDVVRIDVSVMNGLNPVAGLKPRTSSFTDNGVPQKIDSVSLDTVPLNLMLVLDTSGSLAGERLTAPDRRGERLVDSRCAPRMRPR